MPPSDVTSSSSAQADPLPSKRGEIGYIEVAESSTDALNVRDLPRDDSSVYPGAVNPPPQSDSVVTEQSPPTATISLKSHRILDLFKPAEPSAFGGLRLFTLVALAVQLILLGGTVAVWVIAAKRLFQIGQLTIVPFHIVFVLLVLIQVVLLERRVFQLRGERYNYVRPGEILPRRRSVPRSSIILAFAPWNRPSLPTYAVALSESGVGTGDVEDHLIPCLPPPAYGNTRDSTLVLLQNNPRTISGPESSARRSQGCVSGDEQGDLVQNAELARRLEETMNGLEPPSAAHIVIR